MSLVNEVAVFTSSINNELFVLPQGARSIDLINLGGSDATVLGNTSKGTKTVSPITIPSNVAFSFPWVDKPYPTLHS